MTIIVGDFNNNTRWDEWDRWWNHSDVVNESRELGIECPYQKYTGEQQGAETKPTLYFQRKLESMSCQCTVKNANCSKIER